MQQVELFPFPGCKLIHWAEDDINCKAVL